MLRQEKVTKKKATPVRRRCAVPCVARLVRRLRNSRYALKQSSPKAPDQPAQLGGAQGKEKLKSKPNGGQQAALHIEGVAKTIRLRYIEILNNSNFINHGRTMLSKQSILKRLPDGMNQKQLVFLDGIRHAAEITWFAHARLEETLTWLVDNQSEEGPNQDAYTAAFMDAWAMVDAIDRFRSLWKMIPGFQVIANHSNSPSFEQLSQSVRNVRNVSDHLAQRAEYIAASGNPVMGLLTWVTYPRDSRDEIYTCVLAPGTRKKVGWTLVNPAGMEFVSNATQRTGMIHLAAGEHQAHLSALLPEMQMRVRQLEISVESAIREHGFEGKQAGSDFFFLFKGTLGNAFKPEVPESN